MTFTIAAGHNSSLGYLPPASFAAALINPEPSLRVDH